MVAYVSRTVFKTKVSGYRVDTAAEVPTLEEVHLDDVYSFSPLTSREIEKLCSAEGIVKPRTETVSMKLKMPLKKFVENAEPESLAK